MSKHYEAFVSKLELFLAEKNRVTDVFELAEKKTGVKKVYIAQGLIGFMSLYMILGHFAQLICNLVGFAYPAYCSIHAIESNHKEDDTKWLTYWVVYAFFATSEFFADIIFSWFPFYWLAKIVFLVWCFLPISGNGSMVIYQRFIRPVFLKNKGSIDNTMNRAAGGIAYAAASLHGDKGE